MLYVSIPGICFRVLLSFMVHVHYLVVRVNVLLVTCNQRSCTRPSSSRHPTDAFGMNFDLVLVAFGIMGSGTNIVV